MSQQLNSKPDPSNHRNGCKPDLPAQATLAGMVSPARSSTSRRRRDHAGNLIIGGLILLGLIASVFLIFSSSVQLVRVGLVVALWAAVIGAAAATRYRREAAVGQAKAADLQTIYTLQLEREISARREYELGVEARVRAEVGADATEMAALRAELTVLRENLQRLFDGDLPADRPALRADAVRLQELPSADNAPEDPANDNPEETDTWDAWSSPVVARFPVTPVFEADHPEPPAFASPFDEPVTAETQVVTADDLDAFEAAQEGFGRLAARYRGAVGRSGAVVPPGGARERRRPAGAARAGRLRRAPPSPRPVRRRLPRPQAVRRRDHGQPEVRAEYALGMSPAAALAAPPAAPYPRDVTSGTRA